MIYRAFWIKVERPEGDFARGYDTLVNGQSAYFVWINRGKESVCLNLKDARDVELMKSMLSEADVFIQNLGPGVIDRLGLDVSKLMDANPRLIVCSISGYGSEGPAKNQKAYDLLIQAETGLSAINGTAEGPARVGVSVCDIAAGMTAHAAILEALIGRNKTGKGREIEVSLFHAMADWMNVPYLQYKYGGKAPTRMGLKHPTIAPYGAYMCADGKEILISIQNEREWAKFCEMVLKEPDLPKKPGWRSNSERVEQREVVDQRVASVFLTMTRVDAIELVQKAGVAFGRLSDIDDLISHPQHRLLQVTVEGKDIRVLGPGAVTVGKTPMRTRVPAVGQNTDAIRSEFAQAKQKVS